MSKDLVRVILDCDYVKRDTAFEQLQRNSSKKNPDPILVRGWNASYFLVYPAKPLQLKRNYGKRGPDKVGLNAKAVQTFEDDIPNQALKPGRLLTKGTYSHTVFKIVIGKDAIAQEISDSSLRRYPEVFEQFYKL